MLLRHHQVANPGHSPAFFLSRFASTPQGHVPSSSFRPKKKKLKKKGWLAVSKPRGDYQFRNRFKSPSSRLPFDYYPGFRPPAFGLTLKRQTVDSSISAWRGGRLPPDRYSLRHYPRCFSTRLSSGECHLHKEPRLLRRAANIRRDRHVCLSRVSVSTPGESPARHPRLVATQIPELRLKALSHRRVLALFVPFLLLSFWPLNLSIT